MTASLLENLEMDWEMTVLPQPKAPGTAHVPPSTEGKIASTTRRPVVRAWLPGIFCTMGRARRTGQKWANFNSWVWCVCSL